MSGITITERAASRIRSVLQTEAANAVLRVSVNGGGCSGFQYVFGIDTSRQDDDVAFERNGATVLVDTLSLNYIDGSTLDFVDDLMGQSFKLENPNAVASCGCGVSFSV